MCTHDGGGNSTECTTFLFFNSPSWIYNTKLGDVYQETLAYLPQEAIHTGPSALYCLLCMCTVISLTPCCDSPELWLSVSIAYNVVWACTTYLRGHVNGMPLCQSTQCLLYASIHKVYECTLLTVPPLAEPPASTTAAWAHLRALRDTGSTCHGTPDLGEGSSRAHACQVGTAASAQA